MLKKISCNIFLQKEIVFHEGLNAIVGDDIASNSIGKSTMLMIIDFVLIMRITILLEVQMNTNLYLFVIRNLKFYIV